MRKILKILFPWKVIALFTLLFFFSLSQGFAAEITLEWDPNTEPDLDHYVVYWGTSPRGIEDYPNNSGVIDKSLTTYTITGLTEGQIYYFAAKAVDTEGLESDYCDEIDTRAPHITSPPTVTSITDTTAIIEWSTDERSTSVVYYKKTELPSYTEKELTDYVINHSVMLTGLEPDSSYVFYVGSTDIGGLGPDWTDTDNNPSTFYTFQTGAGSDITAPQITSPPTVTSITDTTAVVEWQTDEPSTSVVQYGTSSGTWGNYQWENTNTSLVTTHSVTLTGLTADTQYYFRVGSTDGFINGPTTSNEVNFTTESGSDITPPQITTPPTVTGITQTTAVIEWQTDEPSDSAVDYGLTASYDSQATLPDDVTNHSVTLTGLTAGTEYHFQVGSTDAAGNGPTSSIDTTFTTETVTTDDQAPEITSAPTVTNITDTTAVITWETDEPSNSMVRYDTISSAAWADYLSSENDAGMVTSHSVTVTGLTANQTYYFMVGSTDAFGNGPDTSTTDNNPSAQQYLTTELTPDTTAPVIASVTVPGTTDTTAIITWTTDEPSNSMVQYGSSSTWGNYQWSENDAGMVTSHTVTITGLTQGSTYYFRVGSTDASGNGPDLNSNATNPSAQQSVITDTIPDTTAPVISSVTVAGTTDTTAIITWTTHEPSNSMVHYGATSQDWGSYNSVENDAEMVTSHSVTLTGLTVGTYHFRVGSTDASGNGPDTSAIDNNPSDDDTFITTAPDTAAPVIEISSVIVVGTTDTTATITWTTDELSNTMVRYDTVSRTTWAGYQGSKNDAQMVKSHSITLTGLTKGTTYHFRVGSTDVFGNGPDTSDTDNNPIPNPPTLDSSFTTTNTDTDPPSIIGYAIDYFNDTIDITYSEANIQNATIEANYLFSDDTLSFRTPGGSDDITYIGDNTYRLFLSSIPQDKSFTVKALSGITDEAGNSVTGDEITINIASDPDRIKEVIPHHNAGITDTTRIPHNTSFAVRIEDLDGIDTTDNESIIFTIDDGVNWPSEYNVGNTEVVRVVQLDPTEDLNSLTKLWVVYDRSTDDTYGNAYSFGTTVEININVKNGLEQGTYSFKVETQQQHDDAIDNLPPTTATPDSPSPGLTTTSVDSGALVGAKIIFDSNETVPPTFGPLSVLGSDEPPLLNISNVQAVGSSALNLQPPTVFDDPANNPVTIFIPCPGHPYASTLNIYRYKGTNWILACDIGGNVETGGEGWIVPGSRVNHDNGSPSTIEIQVYHFTGVQAGFSSGSVGRSTDDVVGGGCFIATAAYGSNMDWHVKILSKFRDRYLLTNSIGRGIVDAYYTLSPPVASYLHKHPSARAIVRYALIPITGIAYISLSIHPLVLLFAFALLLLTIICLTRYSVRSRINISQ